MEKEFNLSNCILKPPRSHWINIHDIKEFIALIKFNHTVGGKGKIIIMKTEDLNKLAGSKLS